MKCVYLYVCAYLYVSAHIYIVYIYIYIHVYIYIYIYIYVCVFIRHASLQNVYSKNVHFSKVTKCFVGVDEPSHWGHVGAVTILRRFVSVKTATKFAEDAFIADSVNLVRCTRARRTRIMKTVQFVHVLHAPAPPLRGCRWAHCLPSYSRWVAGAGVCNTCKIQTASLMRVWRA